MNTTKKVAVIGGGAAGFFAAISCKTHHPEAQVFIIEKTSKLLAKVKVSGGGRCNVTNGFEGISGFAKHYPRGEKQLKKAFGQFNSKDTIEWFENRGVALKTEPDGRMFPTTDQSQTIINCLMQECKRLGIQIRTSSQVQEIVSHEDSIELVINGIKEIFQSVIIATGGQPKKEGFQWLKDLGHQIIEPVPSLFTFNMPKNPITKLMGLSVPNATVRIQGTKLEQSGPLLITHWGMSGPAVLKTSAWGARTLNELNYQFVAHVNWLGSSKDFEVKEQIDLVRQNSPKKLLKNLCPFELPQRFWEFQLNKCEVDLEKPWAEVSKKHINKLIEVLVNDQYPVSGKTTFKEEFVTAGGIDLAEVDFSSMQSRVVNNLYFAGEVLNIDGVTGGFNFQAAWTTGYIAGKHCLA